MKKGKKDTAIQHVQDVDSEEEWVIPTGAPEEFGFPTKSTLQQRQCWQNQERFLAAFRQCCRIGEAAEAVGLTRWAVERWGSTDLYGFKKRMAMAEGAFLEKLKAEADRRALEGIDHPVIHQGVITDTYKQYSDNLLMFRMKRLQPEYRDSYQAPSTDQQVPVTQIIINLAPGVKMPDSQPTTELQSPSVEAEYREVQDDTPD